MKQINGEKIIENYLNWLKQKMSYKEISQQLISIDAPFLDSHNDYLRIYIKKEEEDKYYLTDGGFIFSELELGGVILTKKRKELLVLFVSGQGVLFNDKTKELFVYSNERDLPQKKNDIIQTMINVGDMFMLSQKHTKSLFFEDVSEYFKKKELSFVPDVFVSGQAFQQKIDYVIPQHKNKPMKIIKLMNKPTKTKCDSIIFSFIDIKKSKGTYSDSKPIVIINDDEEEKYAVKAEYLEAIRKYDIEPVLWSDREKIVLNLAD